MTLGHRSVYARRQNEHATHLNDRGHAVEPVIHVESRSEPREVHPRPPDREEDHGVAEHSLSGAPVDDPIVQVLRSL
ncbi:hypothetical protein DC31_10315 [Microbacterium sp. CH12i]|nr:hypothetical protein DC31_10315 [Microbacterium sp. CH12i]